MTIKIVLIMMIAIGHISFKPSKRWVEEVVEDNEKLEEERNGTADVDNQPKIS